VRYLNGLSVSVLASVLVALMFVSPVSVVSTPAAAAIVPAWSVGADMGDVRTQAVVVQDEDGIVYVIGGVTATSPYVAVDSVNSYNPATGEWTDLASMPTGVRGASGGLGYDGRIYVFGGEDTSYATSSATQIYDPASDSWTTGTSMPVALWEAKCASYSSYLFVAGGESSGAVDTLYRYTVESDSWTTMAPMPVATVCGTFVYANGYLYYMGGVIGAYTDVTDAVWRYYYWSDTWEAAADMPVPLAAHAAVLGFDGMVYVFGGGDTGYNAASSDTFYASGYVYNPYTDEWADLPDMSVPRKYLGAARTADGMIMSFGGNNYTDVFATVEEMRIAEATVTLSDSTVSVGDTIVLSLESDFAFAVEEGAYAEGYLVSDTDVVYSSAYIYVLIDGVGAMGLAVPEYAVPGSYTAVISYWHTYLEDVTYEWPSMEFAVTVDDDPTVEERIVLLEDMVTSLQAQVVALEAQLDVQAEDITALQVQLDEIMAASEGLNATLTDEVAALQERIDALEASNAELSDSVDTKMESMLGYVIILLVVVVLVLALMNMMMIRKGSRPPPAP